MKSNLIRLLFLTFCIHSSAQINFEDHIIATTTDGAISAHAADLDGDGDIDVVSASYRDDTIAWYENTDGLGNFGPQQIISSNVDGARSIITADIDGDGDMDVLSASSFDNKIVWFENDGSGSFSAAQIITQNAINAKSVFYGDIDGDGDMDVISTSWIDNKVVWHENLSELSIVKNKKFEFSVFPVPTTDILKIMSKVAITEIELYNLLGQVILSNRNQNSIDLSALNSGIYFIRIKNVNGLFGTSEVVKN